MKPPKVKTRRGYLSRLYEVTAAPEYTSGGSSTPTAIREPLRGVRTREQDTPDKQTNTRDQLYWTAACQSPSGPPKEFPPHDGRMRKSLFPFHDTRNHIPCRKFVQQQQYCRPSLHSRRCRTRTIADTTRSATHEPARPARPCRARYEQRTRACTQSVLRHSLSFLVLTPRPGFPLQRLSMHETALGRGQLPQWRTALQNALRRVSRRPNIERHLAHAGPS